MPDRFSPSSFAALVRCPLSQLHGLGERERLAPDGTAIFGTAIHETMARLRANPLGGPPGEGEVLAEFAEILHRTEEGVRRNWPEAGLVPLQSAVGRTAWRRGRARLLHWAADLAHIGSVPGPHARTPGEGEVRAIPSESVRRIPSGRERRVDVPELRLSGRPDLVEREAGVVHVTDLKSGGVVYDGRLRQEYVQQLSLYALMLEALEPGVRIRLWIHGADRVEVPWTDQNRAWIRHRLDDLLARLPAGRLIEATELASTGTHCRLCRVRHRCPRYRSEAVIWWKRTSSVRPVAPYDTWGEPTDLPAASAPSDGRRALRDAAGRTVLISGGSQWSFESGERAWFFGLRPDETTPMHGTYTHPRNFRVTGAVIHGVFRSGP